MVDSDELKDPLSWKVDVDSRARLLNCEKSLLLCKPLANVHLILRRAAASVVSQTQGISHTEMLALCHLQGKPVGGG
jgi:hypothetical protein